MLSYKHIFHAGCMADVHKHSLLSLLLTHLIQDESPLSYIETHAGSGFYDLSAKEAQKTGEYKDGIERIQYKKNFPSDHPYIQAFREARKTLGKTFYPGSPFIAQHILRAKDPMHLFELHNNEYDLLEYNIHGRNVRTYHRSGYECKFAIAPPPKNRGIVFIDPSFEIKTEYQDVVELVKALNKNWYDPVIALWYPMLKSELYKDMIIKLKGLNIGKNIHDVIEFNTDKGMLGSGLLILNAPEGIQEKFQETSDLIKSVV